MWPCRSQRHPVMPQPGHPTKTYDRLMFTRATVRTHHGDLVVLASALLAGLAPAALIFASWPDLPSVLWIGLALGTVAAVALGRWRPSWRTIGLMALVPIWIACALSAASLALVERVWGQ